MTDEVGIRSEKSSLESLRQTLRALREGGNPADTEELAHLLLMATELYADSGCLCEEKAVSYGEEAEEALTCRRNVAGARGEMLDTFRELVVELKR